MNPFFSIVTRTIPERAALLERCRASVSEQTCKEVEHLIIVDRTRRGVAYAQTFMHHAEPRGQYVFVLDDDDYLSAYDVLDRLREQLRQTLPQVAVVKVAHALFGEMPRSAWGEMPREGEITVSNVVVTRKVFYATRGAFAEKYAGDYSWIQTLFEAYKPQWFDLELVTVDAMRNGAAA